MNNLYFERLALINKSDTPGRSGSAHASMCVYTCGHILIIIIIHGDFLDFFWESIEWLSRKNGLSGGEKLDALLIFIYSARGGGVGWGS